MIEALTGKVPGEFIDSTTAAFKFVPFNNLATNRDVIAKLVDMQKTTSPMYNCHAGGGHGGW